MTLEIHEITSIETSGTYYTSGQKGIVYGKSIYYDNGGYDKMGDTGFVTMKKVGDVEITKEHADSLDDMKPAKRSEFVMYLLRKSEEAKQDPDMNTMEAL